MLDASAVEDALAELGDIVQDGMRFECTGVDEGTSTMRLRLGIDPDACAECILPADALADVVQYALRERLGDPSVTVLLEDPRARS
jgi:hypothetical protein